MKRPSFQFYPADWRSNAKLQRCSFAAQGAWMAILGVLHDSDEYGIARWPLADLARAARVPLKLAKELAEKGVLKGGDNGMTAFTYTPNHAGKRGETITLIEEVQTSIWFSSRMVRDEYIRQNRGKNTQFTPTNQPPKDTPIAPPKVGIGERQGDGSSSSSSSSSAESSSVEAKASTGGEPPDWWPCLDAWGRAPADITEQTVYRLGKAILGENSGGTITNLRKLYRNDLRSVGELFIKAQAKGDAKEWIGGVLKRAKLNEFETPSHELYPESEY